MTNHLREIKEFEGDPETRRKVLEVLGLPPDATPEEFTMAFLTKPDDDPAKDHHRLSPEVKQLLEGWGEDGKRKKALQKKKKAA